MRSIAVHLGRCLVLLLVAGAATAATLRVALSAEPSSLDPHFHNLASNNNLAAHVFETLTRFDSDSRLVPGLAESWRLVDERTWEFRLRRGVKFHDGTELVAADVAWSLDRPAAVPNSPGPFTLYTRPIIDKEIVDPSTIRLRTASPYPLLLNDLSALFIVSRRSTENVASGDFASGRGMNGTGPFRFVAASRGERIELARHDGYWGERSAWDGVTFKFLANDAARLAALLSGDVDAIDNVPSADVNRLRNDPRFHVAAKTSHRLIYFTLDQGRETTPFATDRSGRPLPANPFRDLRVRRAVSKAINRQLIADRVMEGLGVPTANLVPSPMFGFNPALKVEPYDPEGARRLLAEAGYPDGFGLTIHGPNNRYVNDDRILQAVAQMLVRVGVDTRVEAMPLTVFFPRANRKEFTMALAGWGSQTGEVSSPLRSVLATIDAAKGMGTVNFGAYSNRRLDALLDEALRTVDDARRERLLQDAVAVAIDDVGLVPLHHQVVTWGMKNGIAYVPRIDERTYAQQFVVVPTR